MNHLNCCVAKVAAAAFVAVIAFALAPTLIDTDASRVSAADDVAAHSWLADAFPTGQATFARSAGHGS